MKLQYRVTNAYNFMLVFDTNHAETYMMDGSEDFPILTDTAEAESYLRSVAAYIENLSGADYEFDRDEDEPVDDFFSRICVDDDHCDEVIAEIEI